MPNPTTRHRQKSGAHGDLSGVGATAHHTAAILESLLTTLGDTLQRGASDPERLAIGATGEIYQVVSGVPAWVKQDIGARAYHDAAQSIAHNVATTIALNQDRFDTDTIHDPDTNNSRLTATTAGKYVICGNVSIGSHATGRRQLGIMINGGSTIALSEVGTNQNSIHHMSVATIYELAAADYVEMTVWQTSGAARDVQANGYFSPEFSMMRLPG